MHRAAVRAGAQRGVGIEPGIDRRQVIDDADQINLGPVHAGAARKAIPFHCVQGAFRAGRFDHQPDRAVLRALRRMAHMGGQKENVALADRHVIELAAGGVEQLQDHVALQLIEEFLDRIVVIIGALVRPANHGDRSDRRP